MKNFWKFAQAIGLLCLIGACLMFTLNAIAVIAASFGHAQPFRYLQIFRTPYWSVALPALGILMFLPLALRQAFTYETASEKAAERLDLRQIRQKWRSLLRLRPV